ncbi:MAG: L-seryl-tRNA(Sec) selenium transferase [Arenibacterium sp.]
MNKNLQHLPQIDALLRSAPMAALSTQYSHGEVVDALRGALGGLRRALLAGHLGELPDFLGADFASEIETQITSARAPIQKPVINATGILVHTNLGRAPLADEAIATMQAVAASPSNLEYDLESGKRGNRMAPVEDLLRELTGAEAAFVVNNCAAAVMLALVATAMGRKVVASRGELIEIGGSFRLPDIIQQSGANLREVGTTNKTRASDYADAIEDDTAVLLKSHTSNYQIIGFTSAPARTELAGIARQHDVILIEDLGSGVLCDLSPYGLGAEPVVRDVLAEGVDLVMFSGDKLLGGPQAGILAGRADVIQAIRRHPLARAVRLDKLSLAALEATLRLYRAPYDPFQHIPVLRMLATSPETVLKRAKELEARISANNALTVRVIETEAEIGGGALPGQKLASAAVALGMAGVSAEKLARRLRAASRPIISRIQGEEVLLDLRAVDEGELESIVATCAALHRQ